MVQKIIIIGAGPAGVLLAHYLLRRKDVNIELYDRRGDLTLSHAKRDRTFPISLFLRGRLALREITGLEEKICDRGTFCKGTLTYRGQGKTRLIPRKEPILTIDRNDLVRTLIEILREKYDRDRCTIHFNYKCIGVNTQARIVKFKDENEQDFSIQYDRLIGVDGSRSTIRQHLQEKEGLNCKQEYVPDAYKSIFLPRIRGNVALASDKIHAWRTPTNITVLLVPQFEEFLNGVIIFPADKNPLERLTKKTEILAYFQKNFPIFASLMSLDDAEIILQHPVSRVLTVRCDRFHHGDRILILGDAAHAVSPSIGQGCNSALEDVLILDRLVEKYAGDWAKICPAFSKTRLADAHAVQELSNYAFPRNKRLAFEFFSRLLGQRFLHKLFPNSFQPFFLDLLSNSTLSYAEILHHSRHWIAKVKRSQEN